MEVRSAVIALEDYEKNGVHYLAEKAYILTAKVIPEDVTEKAADWSVSFYEPESAWTKVKTATDYVNVEPTSDGALTAKAVCLKSFGEPIMITVTLRSDLEIFAVCRVDYQMKTESWSAMIMGADFKTFQLEKSNEIVYLSGFLLLGSGASTIFTSCKLSTDYTLSGREYNYRAIEMRLTEAAKAELKRAGIIFSTTESTLIWKSDWDGVGSSVNMDGLHKFTDIFFLQPDKSKLSAAFDAAAYDVNFRLILGHESGGSVEVYEEFDYQINLNTDFFKQKAEGIELDRNEIIY